MGRDRDTSDLARLGIGLGIGLGVGYALSRLLDRGGGGSGLGDGRRWSDDGRQVDASWISPAQTPVPAPASPRVPPASPSPAQVPMPPSPSPSPSPPAPAPARRRDDAPVEARVRPATTDSATTVIEMEGRVVSVGELAERISAGGRRDVLVTVRGDARQGGWEEIRRALDFLGIQILMRQS